MVLGFWSGFKTKASSRFLLFTGLVKRMRFPSMTRTPSRIMVSRTLLRETTSPFSIREFTSQAPCNLATSGLSCALRSEEGTRKRKAIANNFHCMSNLQMGTELIEGF